MEISKRNRIIAREIIIFFSLIIFLVLVWLFFIFRNSYNVKHIELLNKKEIEFIDQINNLPTDKIKWLYQKTSMDFVENYQVYTDEIVIPKRNEKAFLKKYPYSKHLDIYPGGYSYIKSKSIVIDSVKIKYNYEEELGKKIKKNFDKYSEVRDRELGINILKLYNSKPDSIIVFDFVELNEFRIFFRDSIYRKHFFATFFDKLDMESHTEFQKIINEGLAYSDSSIIQKNELLKEIDNNRNKINQLVKKRLNQESKQNYLGWIALIIGILLYPVRVIFIMIKWSIETLKTPPNN